MRTSFYQRWAWSLIAVVVAAVPFLGYGVREALRGGENDVRQWLPAGSRETRNYDWFLEQFGSEEMAVVSWPGATLDDPRLRQVSDGLRAYAVSGQGFDAELSPDAPSASDRVVTPIFSRVLTSREALDELMAPPLQLSRGEAIRRLQGTLLGPDGQTSALVVIVNEAGARDREAALQVVTRAAAQAGLSPDDLRMGGPTVESVALDSESQRSRYVLAGIAVMITLILAWRCLRQPRLVVAVFSTAVLSAVTAVAMVHYTGESMTLLLVMMPTLVYVLALSGGVHLANYYRDAAASGPADQAPLEAVRLGWLSCVLSAATTAIGLGSLAISEIGPVRGFGIYSAAGVLISLPMLLLFLPAVLQVWPGRPSPQNIKSLSSTAANQFAAGLVDWIVRHHRWVVAAGIGLMVPAGLALFRLDTSVKLLNLFSPEAKIIRDYTWLEQHLGPLVPVEVVLQFDEDNPLTMLRRVELVRDIQRELERIEEVGGTMSAATFVPPLPEGDGALRLVHGRMFEQKLDRNRDQLADFGFFRDEDRGELWRVSARVEALNAVDYGEFMGRVADRVEPVLNRASSSGEGRVEAIYTGIVPLIYKAQRTLLADLTSSFVTAFLLIGGVMAVLLRSLRAGLVSMLPNVFPAVIIFGVMALMGTVCDIGSMMTAGVAMGIAVDDTIHYLGWFRRGMADGLSRRQAIALAYDRCAGAMVQSTVICGIGLLVFALSSFVPTSRFAWMMAAMLGTALLGDLLLLPALLAGPLGRYFEPAKPEVESAGDPVLPGHLATAG